MASPALAARLAELQARAPRGMVLGLDRMERLVADLGSPHASLAVAHVAGSNGKGSVSAMIESIARAAGLRTGLYTSPHLCRFAERIRIAGEPIDDDAFAAALGAVEARAGDRLTLFEALTAAAFVAFRDAGVDLAVLEVGLGGRLDATNVVAAPLATAITSITLEHTAILGDTLAAIAREKAGILKPGAPAVIGPMAAEARAAIDEVAAKVGAGPVEHVAFGSLLRPGVLPYGVSAGRVEIVDRARALGPFRPGLEGPHQAANAVVAAGVAWHLARRWPQMKAAIVPGIEAARWPGRFERIRKDEVLVILDCAHNLQGAEALADALEREPLDPSRTALVFGALADKDWRPMLTSLAGFASRRYYAEPKGRAPAPLADLAAVAPGEAVPEPRAAIARALAESKPGGAVIVTGSIYLVGEVRAEILGIEADPVIAL